MRSKAIGLVMAALLASAASGQPPAEQLLDRVFHFTHDETAQDMGEIATAIRSTTDIQSLYNDAAQKTMSVRGTAGQIALAEWLFSELDRQPSQTSAPHEYRLPGSGDDVVRVFYLAHAETALDLQEVATLVRSMGDIRRLFTYTAPRALVSRGTAGQIALAEWLITELDRRPSEISVTHEYRLPGSGDDVVRVFYLMHPATPQRLQEIAVQVRTTAAIRRLFTYNAPRAMALRGTADQMTLADRLIKERDR